MAHGSYPEPPPFTSMPSKEPQQQRDARELLEGLRELNIIQMRKGRMAERLIILFRDEVNNRINELLAANADKLASLNIATALDLIKTARDAVDLVASAALGDFDRLISPETDSTIRRTLNPDELAQAAIDRAAKEAPSSEAIPKLGGYRWSPRADVSAHI